jgi:hypothetical protein
MNGVSADSVVLLSVAPSLCPTVGMIPKTRSCTPPWQACPAGYRCRGEFAMICARGRRPVKCEASSARHCFRNQRDNCCATE